MMDGEQERYSRQILFQPIGEEGQRRIRHASVAVLGCGALGSFQADALARAGVGRLVLIDRDYVEFSNLQRQWLYDESDAAAETPKALAAKRHLARVNRRVAVDAHVADFAPSNAEELVDGVDLVLDGSDNFEARYLLNDVCVKFRIPWVYGAAIGSYGITMPIVPEAGPCFACVYPEPPSGMQPTCDVDGVLASTTGAVAALQVAAGLRLLVGWPGFNSRIHTLDVWEGTSKWISAGTRDEECIVCGKREFRFLEERRRSPVSLCGRNAVQLHATAGPLDLKSLADRLKPMGDVRLNDFALRLSLPKYDVTVFSDGRAIVKGTTNVGIARSVFAQLVGN
jgi:molybdopterin/thiamine biosynthesis adenylyltransferase